MRIKEAENKIARRELVEKVLSEKAADGFETPLPAVKTVGHLKTAFVQQLRPLDQPIRLAAVGGGGDGGKGGSGDRSDPSTMEQQQFVEQAFSKAIRDDMLNTLISGLVRRSHILLYAEDPWSEGYSIPLLSQTATHVGAQVIAVDIPDWAVLLSRIDPLFEDLTIVSHPYSPPPDLEEGEGGRGMAFFAGIGRKRQHSDGDSMSEQVEPAASKEEAEEDEDEVARPHERTADGGWAKLGRNGKSQDADDDGGDPALSKEMMNNPLSREATERLDRALSDFVSVPVTADGINRPRVIAVKHLGDLMNTRVGYTAFSRLVSAVDQHNRSVDATPVVVVGLMHPSWFNASVPPPGIPPFDVNPATPVALMPHEERADGLSRGVGGIIEGLLGGDSSNRSVGSNGRLGVHVVQMGEPGGGNRISRALGAAPKAARQMEELPLFARIGIPPPARSVSMAVCDMQSTDADAAMVGTLRQLMVADQCLERNAKIIRNICLLYRVSGLELNEREMDHLSKQNQTEAAARIFYRESLYNEPEGLPKLQPRRNLWHLDYRPLTAMLRSMPDDVARRFFLGETILHRWISLAQALAIREQVSLEDVRRDPGLLAVYGRGTVLKTEHLVQAWTQLLESYVALRNGVDEADRVAATAETKEALSDTKAVEDSKIITPLHQMVDFGEIGIGRKALDEEAELASHTKTDLDSSDAATIPRQWADVSRELEADDEDGSSDEISTTQLSAHRRIQQARRNLTEYEQRLIGSVVDPQSIPTGFSQVCVKPETVTTLQEIITLPMLRPAYFSKGVLRRYGVSGILLFGPPGTGKTMLAKAVAKESGSVVLNIRASDIYDKYVGEGEKLAEAVFTLARKLAPCVIFIDEVDALFSARSSGEANKFRRDIMNQIMSEWDGINSTRKKGASAATQPLPPQVMVMAATNRPFDLDDAILRRLPRRILVDLPSAADREKILAIHLAGEELDSDVDMAALGRRTESFSGSDLKNLCVAAALASLRERVKEEVGDATIENGQSIIDRLRSSKKTGAAASIKLGARHFDSALKSVAPSSSDRMESLVELRKWDKIYGDGAQERKRRQLSMGFAGAADSDAAAVAAADTKT
ncbi:hypothetical protein LPJ53_005651 [Coemansia erecta]|uniref:AAA+ ATPase domain-containing protein n=1 Tax=Coemansia erecta TaxID=147472 RepID=A0A9W7XV68_9FUNG|nr:hypothetical protein LPJ53_005651 [Coemansia erecta]